MAEHNAGRALVLASGSRTRFEIMKSAGLAFTVDPADIDEEKIRAKLQKTAPPSKPTDIARTLAAEKALAISTKHRDEIVIGSDQVLALGDKIFSKPKNREDAHATLMSLRGKTHTLHTGVALAFAGKVSWHYVETASLTVREFSADFATQYLRRVGDDIYASVGAYHIEGQGIQLFEKIEGDYFTILGLPLLALLTELRNTGAIET